MKPFLFFLPLPLVLSQITPSPTTTNTRTNLCPDSQTPKTLSTATDPAFPANEVSATTVCCPGGLIQVGQGHASQSTDTNGGSQAITGAFRNIAVCQVNCEYVVEATGTLRSSDCRSATVGQSDYTEVIYGPIIRSAESSRAEVSKSAESQMRAASESVSRERARSSGEAGSLAPGGGMAMGMGMGGVIAVAVGALAL